MRSSQLLMNAKWENTASFHTGKGAFTYSLYHKQYSPSTWTKSCCVYRTVLPLWEQILAQKHNPHLLLLARAASAFGGINFSSSSKYSSVMWNMFPYQNIQNSWVTCNCLLNEIRVPRFSQSHWDDSAAAHKRYLEGRRAPFWRLAGEWSQICLFYMVQSVADIITS